MSQKITKKITMLFVVMVISIFLIGCAPFTMTYTTDYCEDGIQDRGETDIDCGGQYCDPCKEGLICEEDSDCESESCVDDVCAAVSTDTTADTGTTDITDVITDTTTGLTGTSACSDDDSGNIYLGGTATVTITYSDGTTTTETYSDSCATNDEGTGILTEYDCADDMYVSDIAVTCAFGCAEDGVACAEETVDTDFDDDGLTDDDETNLYGTYPTVSDSDYDGLSDYAEVMDSYGYDTNPLDQDTDADGLRDDKEILVKGTDPTDADTDDDGLSDYDEVKGTNDYFTSALLEDTDGDGLSDYDEIFTYTTDPTNTDTDGDGITDNLEFCLDTDGGIDYTTTGTVSGGTWGEIGTLYDEYQDTCTLEGTDNVLSEYYCSTLTTADVEDTTCEEALGTDYTCEDGACVSSS